PHGAICRATLRAGPVFARRCVPRRSFGITKLHSSRLASRKNRLRRGRVRNGNRPWLSEGLDRRAADAVIVCTTVVETPHVPSPPAQPRGARREPRSE